MLRRIQFGILVFSISFLSVCVWAQQSEDQDLDLIEAEIKKNEIRPPVTRKEKRVPETKIENLSDLSRLQPFSEVSILQKRYMPKTGRFQFFGGLASMVNDPWNSTYGLDLRAAYGITEAWGVEGVAYIMTTTTTQATQDLYRQHNINALSSFGSMAGYTGGNIMWTPIYGKMNLFNRRIIPFDMYFLAGGGSTSLNSVSTSSVSTFSLGVGQVFSLNRSLGFRWVLNLNTYSLPSGSLNNLLLTLGMNYYIPEVKYR